MKKIKRDLTIEKKIAKDISKGKLEGNYKDKDGSIYFWNLIVNIKM